MVADVRPFPPGTPPHAEIYWPKLQAPRWATYLVIRTELEPAALIPAMEARLEQVEPDLSVSSFLTLRDRLGRRAVQPRFNLLLLAMFGTVALVLAMIGTYGVVAYSVSQRTQEIGVRLSLGASSGRVMQQVLGEGLRFAAIGIAIGSAGAFAASRWMEGMLVDVSATDAGSFAGAGILLASIVFVACVIPARRASRIDPVQALRSE